MTSPQTYRPELLSALADGEWVRGAHGASLQDVLQSDSLKSDWDSYQVIGQVLKGEVVSGLPLGADSAFLHRLNARLANEKTAPQGQPVPDLGTIAVPLQPAANDSVFRWKLVAGFASLTAALVVAWNFVGSPDASAGAQLAQNPSVDQLVVASPQGPIVRDARLEELLAAHNQLGGSSLQAPSGFLRHAGFENAQSNRR